MKTFALAAASMLLLYGCGGENATPLNPAVPIVLLTGGSSLDVAPGASVSAALSLTRGQGFTGEVTLTVTGAPSGVQVSLAPALIPAGSEAATVTFSATPNAPSSSGQISITASGPGASSSSTLFTITVTAPNASSLPVLGLGTVQDRFTAELWVRGTTAYTTTWGTRNGLGRGNAIKIWDVSANAPRLVDSIIVTNAGTLGDVQVSDDGTLLVAGIEPTPNGGLAIYALDTPRSARLLARTTGGELQYGVHTAEIARVNGVLYAFCAVDPTNGVPGRLVIVSLANPSQPVTVASLQIGAPFVHDVFVRDGLLFTAEWDDGVGIWDIGGGGTGGTIAAPKRIARAPTVGGNVHNIWWYHDPVDASKRYLFVGEEGPGVIGSSAIGDVHVLDISTITAPTEVARYTLAGAGAHNFSVDEAQGLLYAAFYNGGVRVLDIRGDLSDCRVTQRTADGRCDLTLMGREKAAFTSTGPVFIWGVHWSESGVFASDMLNGLWRITPATR